MHRSTSSRKDASKVNGLLFIISGPSGVGKNTILELVLSNNPEFHRPVSLTSRSIRPGEVEGRDYFFTTQEDFKNRVDDGELFEYVEYAGNLHGLPKKQLEKPLKEGLVACMHMEVDGALRVKEIYPEQTVLIFLMPPDMEALKQRLKERHTETNKQMQTRLQRTGYEIEIGKSKYDYQVINPDEHPELAAAKVEEIISQYT